MKLNKNNKGFTLVEVLGVIVILGIIAMITIFSTINIIGSVKENSYKTTINNIQTEANNYVTEDVGSGKWMIYDGTSNEYQCVSVQNLIDTGYFDKEVLNAEVSKDRKVKSSDNVFLLRDGESKSIIKSVLDYNGVLGNFCSNYDADYNISFISDNNWAKKKDIGIEYSIYNVLSTDSIVNYKYEYNYKVNESIIDNKIENFDYFEEKVDITVEQNGLLTGKINDKNGNVKLVKTLDVNAIDNAGPEIIFGKDGTTDWFKKVSSSITVIDSQSGVKDNSLKYTFTMTMSDTPNIDFVNKEVVNQNSGDGYYYLIVDACDKLGNCSRKVSKTFKLDNTDPIITYGTDGNSSWGKSVSSKISVTDSQSGVDDDSLKYIYSSVKNTMPNIGFTNNTSVIKDSDTGDYYLISKACDKAGNCSTKTSNVFKLDNTAPVINFGTDGTTDWFKKVSSSINATDNDSGIDNGTLKYVFSTSNSGTPSTSFTNGGTVNQNSGDGKYYLVAIACDKVGNCNTKVSKEFKLDNTGPEINFGNYGTIEYVKKASTSINVTDSGSGIDNGTLKYVFSTSNSETPTNTFTNGGTVSKDGVFGTYYLLAKACDKVGNCNIEISKYEIDNLAPIISFGSDMSGVWSKSGSSKINVTDNGSGIDNGTLKYVFSTSTSGTPTTVFTNGETVSKSGVTGKYYIIASACDKVGNCNTEVSSVFNLDNTGPEIKLGTDGTTGFVKSASSSVLVTDSHSGVKDDTLSYIFSTVNTVEPNNRFNNNDILNKTTGDGNYYLVVKACDKIGNCSRKVSKTFKLDNTGPEIKLGTDGTISWVKSVSSKVDVTDNGSGVNNDSLKYVFSSGTSGTPLVAFTNGGTIKKSSGTGNYYLITRACDNIGNCSVNTSNAFKLDNTAPTIAFGTDGSSSWVKSVSSKISATDSNSGIDNGTLKYIFSTDNSATPINSFTNGATVSQNSLNGNYYLIAKACDKAGNCNTKASNSFMLDNTAPTITFDTNRGIWAKKATGKISVSDNGSGVDDSSLKYSFNLGNSAPNKSFTNNSTVTSENGSIVTHLMANACDKAGNCVTGSVDGFKIDLGVPYGSISSTNNVASSQTVTLTLGDNESGVSAYYFGTVNPSINDVTWISTDKDSITTTVSSDGIYYLGIKDAVGNIGVVQKEFYKISLVISNATVTPTYIITMRGNSVSFPTPVMNNNYSFEGWYKNSSYTDGNYISYSPLENSTFYGKTKREGFNVVINYRVNGGTVITTTSGGTWTTDSNGYIYLNGSKYTTTIPYGSSLPSDGLINPDNSSYLYVVKTGYEISDGSEWRCSTIDCSGRLYNDSVAYSGINFCDASNNDCYVTLDVNWVGRAYTVNYVLSGGFSPASTTSSNDKYCNDKYTVGGNHDITGTMVSQTCRYGEKCKLNTASFTRQCHKFMGWTTNNNVDGVNYTEKTFGATNATDQFFSNGDDFTYNKMGDVTLYAVWKPSHTWKGIGNQIHDAGTSVFTCGHKHLDGAYWQYCTVCQMSVAHFNHCYKPTWQTNAKGSMWCPCGVGGPNVTYDERTSFGIVNTSLLQHQEGTWSTAVAHYYGGIVEEKYKGYTLKKLSDGNTAPRICHEHNHWTVTLDKQGGSGGTSVLYAVNMETAGGGFYKDYDSVTNIYTNRVTNSANSIAVPRKTGYTFGGYYTGVGGTGTQLISGTGYKIYGVNPDDVSNTTLYAYWK